NRLEAERLRLCRLASCSLPAWSPRPRRPGLRWVELAAVAWAALLPRCAGARARGCSELEQALLRLIDFHGKVLGAATIGMNDLHQASVGFDDLRRRRAGGEAENLQGFRFRHQGRWQCAVDPIRITLGAAVRDL